MVNCSTIRTCEQIYTIISLYFILMKRTLAETVCSFEPSTKYKGTVSPIFEVIKFDSNNPLPQSWNGASGMKERLKGRRVSASSKVNFSKLNLTEQKLRYINQKNEIKLLKNQLQKHLTKDKTSFQDSLSASDIYTPPYRTLLQTLCKALINGNLLPNTLAYNQICTVLRDLLQIPYSGQDYFISLPDKKLDISAIEYEEYSKIPCADPILLKIIGREQKQTADPFTLLQIFSGPTILSGQQYYQRINEHL